MESQDPVPTEAKLPETAEEPKIETETEPVDNNAKTESNEPEAKGETDKVENAEAGGRGSRRSSRSVKTLNRYEDQFGTKQEKEEWKIPEGKGTVIRDMPNAVQNIQKYTGSSDELKAIHRLLYFRPGKKISIKQNILGFSGVETFPDDENAAKAARIKREEICLKWHSQFIKTVMDILCIDRSSATGEVDKDSLINRLIDWLEHPVDSGINVINRGKKGSKRKKKNAKGSATSTKKKKKRTPTKRKVVDQEDSADEVESPSPKKKKKPSKDDSEEEEYSIQDMFLKGIEPAIRKVVKAEIEKSSSVTFGTVKEVVKEHFGAKAIENKAWLKDVVLDCFQS